jgi:hypothetical protein
VLHVTSFSSRLSLFESQMKKRVTMLTPPRRSDNTQQNALASRKVKLLNETRKNLLFFCSPCREILRLSEFCPQLGFCCVTPRMIPVSIYLLVIHLSLHQSMPCGCKSERDRTNSCIVLLHTEHVHKKYTENTILFYRDIA